MMNKVESQNHIQVLEGKALHAVAGGGSLGAVQSKAGSSGGAQSSARKGSSGGAGQSSGSGGARLG